jgi:ATP-dependent Clp protease ATP-binding subunit ClpB
MEVVNGYFRPEFINRVDDMVVFHPLDDGQLIEIARIQVCLLTERLAGRDIKLEVSNDTVAALAKAGFDPVYGARPLKRAIQRRLENPLAGEILSGRYQSGDVIRVEMKGKDVVFIQQVELPSQAA